MASESSDGDLDAMLRCDDVTYVRAIVKTRGSERASVADEDDGGDGKGRKNLGDEQESDESPLRYLSSFFSGEGKGDG